MAEIKTEDIIKIIQIAVPVMTAIGSMVAGIKKTIQDADMEPAIKENLLRRIEEAQASIPAWEG